MISGRIRERVQPESTRVGTWTRMTIGILGGIAIRRNEDWNDWGEDDPEDADWGDWDEENKAEDTGART